eukprot:GFYU01007839.1.p1 GENE.GFYU01007839.1~~GFYU01007839.1.p1  ORF type:complete len:431 (+),score=77.32 GFYU01007839.1:67-1359(+)
MGAGGSKKKKEAEARKKKGQERDIQKALRSINQDLDKWRSYMTEDGGLRKPPTPLEDPEIDPVDGEPCLWYKKGSYEHSYSNFYRNFNNIKAPIDDYIKFIKEAEALYHGRELMALQSMDAGAYDQGKAKIDAFIQEFAGHTKTIMLEWAPCPRLKDRHGDDWCEKEGYHIREALFEPFLLKYFPSEFTADDLKAKWNDAYEYIKREEIRMAPVQGPNEEERAELFEKINANVQALLPAYNEWLQAQNAAEAGPGKNIDPASDSGKNFTLRSTRLCAYDFQKEFLDTAISCGDFGHHWGFYENNAKLDSWAVTWSDDISIAYNKLEKHLNPSRSEPEFNACGALHVGTVQPEKFEIQVAYYEDYDPKSKRHNDARGGGRSWRGKNGEMIRFSKQQKMAHLQCSALYLDSGAEQFLVFPGGNCLDGIELDE